MSFVILFLKYFSIFLFIVPIYCFVIYPIVLFFIAKFFSDSGQNSLSLQTFSKISFLLPAYNEQNFIEKKLINLSKLSRNNVDIEIIICNDGSSDQTLSIIKNWLVKNPDLKVILIENKTNQGKWPSLKKMLSISTGDIIVFSDISAVLPHNFVSRMISILCQADVAVYAPTYSFPSTTKTLFWEKIYWPLEKFIRQQESRWFSTIGAHGACYALKKDDLIKLELAESNGVGPINDDFIIPSLSALISGKKITYDAEVEIHELETTHEKVEYQRRVRIARGNFLMNKLFLKKISWRNHPKFYFLMFSHKILRSYIGPILCINFLLYSFFDWDDLRYNLISLIFLSVLLALSPIRATAQVFFFDRFFNNQKRWK
jgi:cellulose synthase/poly-beta-1,6-N-acetylglucosamine synthase-like glycosyltransferase